MKVSEQVIAFVSDLGVARAAYADGDLSVLAHWARDLVFVP
jgi:hypothetical protein